ncbi:MAG: glucuronate isomerase [Lentisphaeria bacterium]|jgi:glucuronate isomerase
MTFLGDSYLLGSTTARRLYETVQDLPILDPHNHADVKAIAENRASANLWEAEAATDHYVWELLRKRGLPERLITGAATPREKWDACAAAFPALVGNPTYEWIHLDLRRRFGIQELIAAETAGPIWDATLAALQTPAMKPQALLQAMKVERMCSTDDPLDSLEWHQALDATPSAGVVRPTFRPDKAMNIFKPDWNDYINRCEALAGASFQHLPDLIAFLQQRHDFFATRGCVASDHGVETPWGHNVSPAAADAIFRKARARQPLTPAEQQAYLAFLLQACGEMDAAKGWVFQLHLGCVRDLRDSLAHSLGPDSGGDISNHATPIVEPLRDFLNRFDNRLQTVLYCLEPGHQATLATLARAFGATVSLGSAWWLNDTPVGMRRQLEYIGSVDLLWNFAGMVSDSRKLLSYGSRHEMFRRVLCDVAGNLVERGQAPASLAEKLVRHLSYDRPKQLFNL